jgi:hypothetical protein
MIIDAFLYLASAVIGIVTFVAGSFSMVYPVEVKNSLEYFFGKFAVLENFFPVSTLMTALGTILTFLGFWYGLKLVLWVIGLIPMFKNAGVMPRISTSISKSGDFVRKTRSERR